MATNKLHTQIGQIEVSVYSNGFDAKSRKYIRLQEIADIIITGRPMLSNPSRSIKDLQIEARFKKEELPHSEYQEWKATNLPMFLVTGCFSERKTNALIGPHTSLINVDIDHVTDVVTMKNNIIANEPSLVMAGISPSGDGIKLIFHVAPTPTDATEHKQIATQLHKYLSEKYNIPLTTDNEDKMGIDTAGNRLVFTCFFFHDVDLYLNTQVPSRFQGNIQKIVPQAEEPLENFDWYKLDNVLKFYAPDCSYEDWTDIGMALKHEGYKRHQEELFFDKWDEWSRGSEAQYNASKMQGKWDTFNQDNDKQITLGSIYARAKDNGWAPPQNTTNSTKTDQNRQSAEQQELDRYAQEQNLPIYLRPTPAEDTDMARILQYMKDHIVIVNNKDVYIRTMQGAWDKIEVERANGFLDNILEIVRKKAVDESEKHEYGGTEYKIRLARSFRSTNNHIKAITGRLLSLAARSDHGITAIKLNDFNNRIVHNPTLPLQYGAIDLTSGAILTPDEYAPYHALDTEFWATDYEPEILNKKSPGCQVAKHLIETHYGIELISRIAYHLVTSNKSVDIINIPESSAGKTALAEWLKLTIGNVGIDSRSRSLTAKGDAYTQATAPLTEHLIYFYDEVDKLDSDIQAGILNEMTSEGLTITKKYQNPTPLSRIGVGVLMGADWPPIDTTAQGLDTRITYVYYKNLPVMPDSSKKLLQSDPDTHKYLLARIVELCIKWANGPETEWKNSPEASKARERFFKERTPEAKQILIDTYTYTGNEADYIPLDHIKDLLSGLTDSKQNIHKMVSSIFPKAKKTRKRIKINDVEQRAYVYINIKIKPEEDQTVEPKDIEEISSKVIEEIG